MGNCVAGGGYLPVLCDTILMTEGSGLYLAGPALVKAAIGQEVENEELGGAEMHAEISGTIDFLEPNDESCIKRLQSLVHSDMSVMPVADPPYEAVDASQNSEDITTVFKSQSHEQYDMNELLSCIVDDESYNEYKSEYGRSMVCAYARIGGWPCGIVANQRCMTEKKMPGGKAGPSTSANMPAVIYTESADKAARFIMDCNQKRIPIIFVNDTTGFMVGRDSEQAGIIRSGAKMVNAMSNCIVPKITLIVGSSYGAGNYAMCGRAFDPFLTLAWPNAKFAVMGGAAAAHTLLQIDLGARKRRGEEVDSTMQEELLAAITASYDEQESIFYGAARGWVDRLIEPANTRRELIEALSIASTFEMAPEYKTGVLQT
jgi:3-methylcrotonyl-CoA carboxylase beta subunit